MDYRQIITILSLGETLNFTETAGKLFLSQSTVTRQVQSVEKELGLALFERSNARVSLTPSGKVFCEQAQYVKKEYDTLMAKMHQQKEETQSISIGCHRMMMFYDDDFTQSFLSLSEKLNSPNSIIPILIENYRDGVEKLRNNEIDAYLADINSPDFQDDSYGKLAIATSDCYAAVSKSSALSVREKLHAKDFKGQTIAIYQDGIDPFLENIVSEIELFCKEKQVITEKGTMAFALSDVAETSSVTFVPIKKPFDHNVILIPYEADTPIDVGLVWKKNNPLLSENSIEAIAQCLKEAHGRHA